MTEYVNSEDVLHEVHGLSIEASQYPLPSYQQQLALINLVRVDDPNMKQKTITQNLRLVVNIATWYGDHGVALFDLIREGIQRLIHALENLDSNSHNYGMTFRDIGITYFVYVNASL